jgi:hypothetical protein
MEGDENMSSIPEMIETLSHCCHCKEVQPCVGCPYNGGKVEILQYLKDLRGDFTDRERELLSLGILRLMQDSDRAYGEINSDVARIEIKHYRDELQALNVKVLDIGR